MPDECDVLEDDCFAVERVVAEVGVGEGDRASLNVQGMTILCVKVLSREGNQGCAQRDSSRCSQMRKVQENFSHRGRCEKVQGKFKAIVSTHALQR